MTMRNIPGFPVRLIDIILTVGSVIRCVDSLITLTSQPSRTGTEWKFDVGTTVTINCTLTPYANTLDWKYDSSIAATCLFLNCRQLTTSEGAFEFAFDTTNGIFLLTINPVKEEYNNKVFECHDGTTSMNFTAKVDGPDPCHDQTRCISIVGLVFALVYPTVLIVVLIICYKKTLKTKIHMRFGQMQMEIDTLKTANNTQHTKPEGQIHVNEFIAYRHV